MPQFSPDSAAKLATCHPLLQELFNEAINHIDITIIEGHRGEAEQEAAFAAGKSEKHWPDGNHNAMPSNAVDAGPYHPGLGVVWKDVPAFALMMGYIKRIADEKGIKIRLGLDWNSNFLTAGIADPNEHFLDAPHVELA